MVDQIKSWLNEVNRKQGVSLLLKDVFFSFALKTEQDVILVNIKNGSIALDEESNYRTKVKRIELKSEILHSLLSGERKLREAVKHKAVISTFTFRELLLVESLLFLAKSDKTNMFTKIS